MAAYPRWKQKLYVIIFQADTSLGRAFDVLLLWAIILSVLALILESEPAIAAEYGPWLKGVEWFFTVLFSVEYLLRLVCVRRPMSYMFSFFGMVDFLAIAPTYLSLMVEGTQYLLVIRAIRLLRVFRILKLVRYSKESRELVEALQASRAKITVFLGGVLTIVLIVGTMMHLVEDGNPGFSSIFRGMYWAIVTMTTVGYGDIVPESHLGQFIASVLMVMGYGIIAVPTGIVSAELTQVARSHESKRQCPQCGKQLAKTDCQFCHECGFNLVDDI